MQKWSKIIYLSLILILFFCSSSIIALAAPATNNINNIALDLPYRPLYITCCDLSGTGLKDIIVADTYNLTVFKQGGGLSFKLFTIKSIDKIIAISTVKISKSTKESVLCLGENKIFYFSLNTDGILQGPTYIDLPENHPAFIKKQKSMKNFSFVIDMNHDGLDEIVLPCENGLYILWQVKPSVFKPAYIQFQDSNVEESLNVSPWPKVGDNSDKRTQGVSFFPTSTKRRIFWIQDYNKDGLLDIITLTERPDGYLLAVYLQKQNNEFEEPIYIKLQNTPYSKRDIGEVRLIDINNDGLLDIIESSIEYPLKNSNSLLPIITTKIYLARALFQFDLSPTYIFKTVYIPGLDNIIDLYNDGRYEILTSTSSLKLGTKESIIKIVTTKEIPLDLEYFNIGKRGFEKNVGISKALSMTLPGINELDSFKRFIKFENIKNDGPLDMILLKKDSCIEINLLKKDSDILSISKSIEIQMPCAVSDISITDINNDGKKEFLILGPDGKKLYIVNLKNL